MNITTACSKMLAMRSLKKKLEYHPEPRLYALVQRLAESEPVNPRVPVWSCCWHVTTFDILQDIRLDVEQCGSPEEVYDVVCRIVLDYLHYAEDVDELVVEEVDLPEEPVPPRSRSSLKKHLLRKSSDDQQKLLLAYSA